MLLYTAKEIETLDRIAVESGLEIRQMMELAGFHMAHMFEQEDIPKESAIVIVCGTGNKGGDGLSAARHLVNYGWKRVSVVLVSFELKPDAAHHLALLKHMDIPIHKYSNDTHAARELIGSADSIIDALIGYHLNGAPRGDFAELIESVGMSSARVVAYDLPSGADATTGVCAGACITADVTLTLAVPKKLFETKNGKVHAGAVHVADIGIPAVLYDRVIANSRPDFPATGVLSLSF